MHAGTPGSRLAGSTTGRVRGRVICGAREQTRTPQGLAAIALLVLAAAGASAVQFSVDIDRSTYAVGDDVVITATATLDGEFAFHLASVGLQVTWDRSVVSVKNGSPGHSSQEITEGPGVGGSALTTSGAPFDGRATSACANDFMTCSILNQTWFGEGVVIVDAQTLVGTLVLKTNAVGPLGLDLGGISYDPRPIERSARFNNARVVPEPATGLMLALGLVGLRLAGPFGQRARSRSS